MHQNIVCEFADPDYVVMMLTPEIGDSGLERLKTALSQIKAKEAITSFSPIPMPKKRKLSLKEALFSSSLSSFVCILLLFLIYGVRLKPHFI